MKTYASLFTGFGGADLGAMAAGMQPVWGVEYDAAIAEVGNANLGQHIKVADILDCKPTDFERVDMLHMSPPCTRASVANGSAEVNEDGLKESPLDIAMANKCIEFIETLNPEIVTLENVWAYRAFQSWRGGRRCEGICNALERLDYWISIEHVNAADYAVPQTRRRMIVRAIRGGFVPYLPQPVPWVGWYAAIEDMLDTLPDSQFAPWQLARLPEELKNTFLFMTEHHKESPVGREGRGGIIPLAEPANTVVTGSGSSAKAFIVDQQNGSRDSTVREADEPIFTIVNFGTRRPRAFAGGRVVAMTPRALARFQSFPDSYMLPDSKTLAAKGIGNAVPPLMYQKIVEGLLS